MYLQDFEQLETQTRVYGTGRWWNGECSGKREPGRSLKWKGLGSTCADSPPGSVCSEHWASPSILQSLSACPSGVINSVAILQPVCSFHQWRPDPLTDLCLQLELDHRSSSGLSLVCSEIANDKTRGSLHKWAMCQSVGSFSPTIRPFLLGPPTGAAIYLGQPNRGDQLPLSLRTTSWIFSHGSHSTDTWVRQWSPGAGKGGPDMWQPLWEGWAIVSAQHLTD